MNFQPSEDVTPISKSLDMSSAARCMLSSGTGASTGWGMCRQCPGSASSHQQDSAQASTWTGGQHGLLRSFQRGPSLPKDTGEGVVPVWLPSTLMGQGQEYHPWVDIASTASVCLGCMFAHHLPSPGVSKRRLCRSSAS